MSNISFVFDKGLVAVLVFAIYDDTMFVIFQVVSKYIFFIGLQN